MGDFVDKIFCGLEDSFPTFSFKYFDHLFSLLEFLLHVGKLVLKIIKRGSLRDDSSIRGKIFLVE